MANRPIVNLGSEYIYGLNLVRSGDTTLTVKAGGARDSSNVVDIVLDSDITLNFSTNGVNAKDQGTIATNTFYAIYVIADSTQNLEAATLASTSFTAPSMPFGYDVRRRIGAVLTGPTPGLKNFSQYSESRDRTMWFWSDVTELTGGAATAFTTLDLASSIPSIECEAWFNYDYTPNTATNSFHFNPIGSTLPEGIIRIGGGVAASQKGVVRVPISLVGGVPQLNYKVTEATDSLDLMTTGFIDQL